MDEASIRPNLDGRSLKDDSNVSGDEFFNSKKLPGTQKCQAFF